MELGLPADLAEAGGALLDRLEPELIAVEGARPLEVLSGEFGDGVGVAERSRHLRLLGVIAGLTKRLGEGGELIAVVRRVIDGPCNAT
jgi:hypothetical protein